MLGPILEVFRYSKSATSRGLHWCWGPHVNMSTSGRKFDTWTHDSYSIVGEESCHVITSCALISAAGPRLVPLEIR